MLICQTAIHGPINVTVDEVITDYPVPVFSTKTKNKLSTRYFWFKKRGDMQTMLIPES